LCFLCAVGHFISHTVHKVAHVVDVVRHAAAHGLDKARYLFAHHKIGELEIAGAALTVAAAVATGGASAIAETAV
jgi:hypothetical protein